MSKALKNILVPVDGSTESGRALARGVALARAAKARLTVLEVVEAFGPLPGYYEAAPAGEDRVDWIANQRLEKIHGILDETDIPWERRVEEGYPADVICNVAENYDLIVMGSRGLNAATRFLVGSVSDRVVHHAPCDVMVVK